MSDPRDKQGREEPGADQAQDARGGPDNAGGEKGRRDHNLARWFWGTIVVLAVIALTLELLADRQSRSLDTAIADQGSRSDQAEKKAVWVDRKFRQAGEKTEEIRGRISPLLEEAYKPVYGNIPAYIDFHYSLKGEWLELGPAALGEMGYGLEEYLFVGLERRLGQIAATLERDFDDRYLSALDEAMMEIPGGADTLGPIVTHAIDDAQARIRKTGGTFAATAIGALSMKALTKGFAKKLGVKLAAKVAAKTGTKWMAAAGGAGTGAAACSWAGPGAAGCAVVGAVITWVGLDVAMIKLDEYVTRDDFERDMIELIDLHKAEVLHVLEDMLDLKERTVDNERKVVVRRVALSELRDVDRMAACEAATNILARYDSIRGNLNSRSPVKIAALREDMKEQTDSHLLAPWIADVEAAVADKDLRLWVDTDVGLIVNLPQDLQEDRKIRATLLIGQTSLEFDWTEGDPAGHFDMNALPNEKIILEWPQSIELELIQDRGILRPNRSFTGSTRLDISGPLDEGSGLSPEPKIPLSMLSDKTGESSPRAWLKLPMSGVALSGRDLPEFCVE